VKLGRPKIDSTTERKVRKQLVKGMGILKVAKSPEIPRVERAGGGPAARGL
jgi:hypothetical protein